MTPRVGVVGAGGAVGSAAARALHARGARVRLGGRRAAPLAGLSTELRTDLGGAGAGPEVVVADVTVPASLAGFCAGCDVVVNCAGPSYALGATVARAALGAGADCVEVTGDEPVRAALAGDPRTAGRRVVLSAGLLPGLSALLPRWIAGRRPLRRLRGWAGGLERCTPAAAGDLLLSLPGAADDTAVFGTPGAVWRSGRVVRATTPDGPFAPGFPLPGFVQPFLTREAHRLARDLELEELAWHTVHVGQRTRELLTSLAGRPATDPAAAARRLREAADLDLAGRDPWYLLVLRTTGGDGEEHTVVLRTPDSYRLTGQVGAWAAAEILAGRVPPGVHHAADVLDPARAVDALLGEDTSAILREHAGSGVEEGAL